MAQAASPSITFDPTTTMHYALSEEDQFRLEQVRLGLLTIGHMFEDFPLEDRVEVQADGIAAICRTFSFAVESILQAAPFTGASKH